MPDLIALYQPKNVIVFMLIFTRLSGLFSSAPFFSSFRIPNIIKLFLAGLVAFLMFPAVLSQGGFIFPHTAPQLILLILIEFFLGFLIGFILNLVFQAFTMSGSIVSIQMTLSMSEILDPATGGRASVISSVYTYLATLVFFIMGAHIWIFEALYLSFQRIPISSVNFLTPEFVQAIVVMASNIFQIAFSLIMPIFAVLLVTDLLLGLMAKMMPQMNIFMVSLPFKIYCGLILMVFFLLGSTRYMEDVIKQCMDSIKALFM